MKAKFDFLHLSHHFAMRQYLSLKQKLTLLARMTCQQSSRVMCVLYLMSAQSPNAGSQGCEFRSGCMERKCSCPPSHGPHLGNMISKISETLIFQSNVYHVIDVSRDVWSVVRFVNSQKCSINQKLMGRLQRHIIIEKVILNLIVKNGPQQFPLNI